MQSRKTGQSLTEYTIIGGLMAVVAIVGLIQYRDSLKGILEKMLPAPQQAAMTMQKQAGNPSIPTGSTAENPLPNVSNSMSLPEGAALPSNLSTLVQTVGANGTTALLSDQLRQLGQHLLATGQLAPEQANYFDDLANQGNRISSIERLIEDADRTGSNAISFEGQTYTPYELSQLVGWNNEPSQYYTAEVATATQALDRSPNSRSETMQAFLDSYQKLAQSGAMNNAAVQQAVSALSAKIAMLSEIIESNVSDRYWGASTTSLHDYEISQTSYWSSGQICSTGNGQTVDAHCQ